MVYKEYSTLGQMTQQVKVFAAKPEWPKLEQSTWKENWLLGVLWLNGSVHIKTKVPLRTEILGDGQGVWVFLCVSLCCMKSLEAGRGHPLGLGLLDSELPWGSCGRTTRCVLYWAISPAPASALNGWAASPIPQKHFEGGILGFFENYVLQIMNLLWTLKVYKIFKRKKY